MKLFKVPSAARWHSSDIKDLADLLAERLVLPRAEAETARVAREGRHYLDARTQMYRALPLRPRCASGARPNGGGATIRAFSFREESYGRRA